MCLCVGYEATVYHPMNSSDGKTCLSGDRALINKSSTSRIDAAGAHCSFLALKDL